MYSLSLSLSLSLSHTHTHTHTKRQSIFKLDYKLSNLSFNQFGNEKENERIHIWTLIFFINFYQYAMHNTVTNLYMFFSLPHHETSANFHTRLQIVEFIF